ncbi:MAG: PA2169 family four-helix-bundle protein [Methylocella sp.]
MDIDKDEVISTLNALLQTTKDGEEGFRTCAQNVRSTALKAVFETAATRCDEGAAELKTKIRGLGGQPTERGSTSALLHRGWTNLKASIVGMDDHAVLVECERGEDAAKGAYEAALKKDCPPI